MGLFRSLRRLLALGFCAMPAGTALAQETMYVTDIVQLGVHREQDTSDTAFRNLVSGTEVSVLERVPNYARIRTADGEEGWVRSFYLIDEPPARSQLAALEARIHSLEQELAVAQAASASARAAAGDIADEAAQELAAVETDLERLARLELENQAYLERFERYRGTVPWLWVLGVVAVALGAGFFAGHSWLAAAIRRRYGGFKVY